MLKNDEWIVTLQVKEELCKKFEQLESPVESPVKNKLKR